MTDLDPTRTDRTVMLSVDVATDQELATVHAALSRIAVGYICDGLDSRVYVMDDDEEEEEPAMFGPPDPTSQANNE